MRSPEIRHAQEGDEQNPQIEGGPLESREMGEEQKLNPETAMQEEEKRLGGVLTRIGEKVRNISKEAKLVTAVLIGISALTLGQGSFRSAEAGSSQQDKIEAESTERESQRKKRNIDLIKRLYKLSSAYDATHYDRPPAISPEHNELLKQRAARGILAREVLAFAPNDYRRPAAGESLKAKNKDVARFSEDLIQAVYKFVETEFMPKEGWGDDILARNSAIVNKSYELMRVIPTLRAVLEMERRYADREDPVTGNPNNDAVLEEGLAEIYQK